MPLISTRSGRKLIKDDLMNWEYQCKECAFKRGHSELLNKINKPFICVHRLDEKGRQRVCGGWTEKYNVR
jgi:hypothetical protein